MKEPDARVRKAFICRFLNRILGDVNLRDQSDPCSQCLFPCNSADFVLKIAVLCLWLFVKSEHNFSSG